MAHSSDILADTQKMRNYAARLKSVNSRVVNVEGQLRNIRARAAGDEDLVELAENLSKIIRSNALKDYRLRLAQCADYLNESAQGFETAEQNILRAGDSSGNAAGVGITGVVGAGLRSLSATGAIMASALTTKASWWEKLADRVKVFWNNIFSGKDDTVPTENVCTTPIGNVSDIYGNVTTVSGGTESGAVWPVDKEERKYLTGTYDDGKEMRPGINADFTTYKDGKTRHNGIDFAPYGPFEGSRGSRIGPPVRATVTGRVKEVVSEWTQEKGIEGVNKNGNYIIIVDANGFEHLYAHLGNENAIKAIKVGEKIKSGDTIGAIGETGHSTGVHLHYSVRVPMDDIESGDVVLSEEAKKNGFQEKSWDGKSYYYIDPYVFIDAKIAT